ncbi:signal peptide peptidase SppA, 36K type [Olavius algarvensis associated proteobacterium Delta 3]|nr:signal peptide peptidase SppA, 36K type [Olavius algarvensis associated proteobacterium Delta 3]CAB5146703.1 signal peptide peptidase SppA, 36K type [Olavius algarvensis associated proteobacterium Delta 3]
MNRYVLWVSLFVTAGLVGCAAPEIKLFPDGSDPLEEFTLSGKKAGKVLVIPVQGIISDMPKRGFLRTDPSMVQEVVSQLKMAEDDEDVRSVLLTINSPGGTATATDLLYHEIMAYKQRTGVKVVAAMMNVAASGGYYIALSGDVIFAHPTSITGSVGVVFIRPKLVGLLDKIGVAVEVNKSGKNKDMGSPFRAATEEEERILQGLTDTLGEDFVRKVRKHRSMSVPAMDEMATARIFIAADALKLGMVDKIGYLSDAIATAKKMAGLTEDARVIVYRRTEYANDNIYNPVTTQAAGAGSPLVDTGMFGQLANMQPGFYYLWPSAIGSD